MQGDDGADKGREVDDQQSVVGGGRERTLDARGSHAAELRRLEVREQVEHVLEVVNHLMIHGQLALDDRGEVVLDLEQARLEPREGRQLGGDARGERPDGEGRDVAQEVLDSDLLCL